MTVIKAASSQWSEGKVHVLGTLFSGGTSTRTICGRLVYGEIVDTASNPVTCSHCLTQLAART